MIITAMYMYGLIQDSWEFNWLNITICFLADVVFIRVFSLGMRVKVVNQNIISDEEKHYWNKRSQVEELRRVELDRQLYGKK